MNWKSGTIIAIVLIPILFFIWRIPQFLIEPTKTMPEGSKDLLEIRNEIRKTVVQIVGGAFLIIGLIQTYRKIRVTEEGQITERFGRAIEQLGSDKLEIRIGGIFALERIANDSYKDSWVVMEVLSAFIHEKRYIDKDRKGKKDNKTEILDRDIHAALTVISRRKWIKRESKTNKNLFLDNVNLRNLDLRRANFNNIVFWNSNLAKSSLVECNFQGTILMNTNLSGANLLRTSFKDSYMNNANLEGADLYAANFKNASLGNANLCKTENLTEDQLSKTRSLIGIKLDKELMQQVSMKNPDLLKILPESIYKYYPYLKILSKYFEPEDE